MFRARFFSARYWSANYWNNLSGDVDAPVLPDLGATGYYGFDHF